MPAGILIKHKRKTSDFTAGQLAAGEMGLNTSSGQWFFSIDGATISSVPCGVAPPSSVADQTINAAASALLIGSLIPIPVTKLRIGTIFRYRLSVSKTAAGTAANTFVFRLGTLGTVADPAILTFTLPVGTAVIDQAEILISVTIRGPLSASCIAQGLFRMVHNLQITGFATVPAVVLKATSGVFNATAANLFASLSCLTAASTVLTFQQVQAEALNL